MKISIQHLVHIKKQGNPDWKDRFDALASMLIEQIDILSNTASEFSSFAKFYNEEVTQVDLVDVLLRATGAFRQQREYRDDIPVQTWTKPSYLLAKVRLQEHSSI